MESNNGDGIFMLHQANDAASLNHRSKTSTDFKRRNFIYDSMTFPGRISKPFDHLTDLTTSTEGVPDIDGDS